jgi:hypothetical protein
MGMARYVVDAVLLEGRSAREVAATHRISKSWIYVLIKRYLAGGYEALEPRSRRPRSCEHETPVDLGDTAALQFISVRTAGAMFSSRVGFSWRCRPPTVPKRRWRR